MATITISSGHSSSVVVGSGSTLVVDGGAISEGSVIRGAEVVSTGGASLGDVIERRGAANVRGSASATLIRQGGMLTILDGGVVFAAVDSGQFDVTSGGSANAPTIREGDFDVQNGGSVSAAILNGSAELTVYTGGVAFDTLAKNGGTIIDSGGYISNAAISKDAGVLLIESHGSAQHVILAGGATVGEFGSGKINGVYLRSGGVLSVSTDGQAIDFRVSSGAQVRVDNNGVIGGGYVLAGGRVEFDTSGAVASGLTVSSGGRFDYEVGASAAEIVLRPGAELTIDRTSAAARISAGDLYVYNASADLIGSISLSGGGAGLTLTSNTTSAGVTEFIVGQASPAALAQSLATFGGHAVAAGSSHSAELTSALVEMLKPR